MRYPLFRSVFALCACGLSATAATLFSDLGPFPENVYSVSNGLNIAGTGAAIPAGDSVAELFPVSGSGSYSVSQIDLGVTNIAMWGTNTFSASIWTDSGGTLGAQVPGAYWTLSTTTPFGTCCGLVTVTDITGVALTGGQSYFMLLAPISVSDTNFNVWDSSSIVANGDILTSVVARDDGGAWIDEGIGELGAFDVLGTASVVPEPGTMAMLGSGLLALGFLRKRLHR